MGFISRWRRINVIRIQKGLSKSVTLYKGQEDLSNQQLEERKKKQGRNQKGVEEKGSRLN